MCFNGSLITQLSLGLPRFPRRSTELCHRTSTARPGYATAQRRPTGVNRVYAALEAFEAKEKRVSSANALNALLVNIQRMFGHFARRKKELDPIQAAEAFPTAELQS